MREAVICSGWSGLWWHWWRIFFVDHKGTGLRLCKFFSIDLALPPESCIGSGCQGRCDSSSDCGMNGVWVQSSNGFADLFPLRVVVFAPPHDVIKVAKRVPTVVADSRDSVVDLGKLYPASLLATSA